VTEAERWMAVWEAGESHFGRCCAAALAEGDLAVATKFSAQWARCHARFRVAWLRQLTASAPLSQIDWFGDG